MRITDTQTQRMVVNQISKHKVDMDKYSNQITTGLKVSEAGDTKQAGTIARYIETTNRNEAHLERIANVTSMLEYQDGVVSSLNDYVIRAKEIATEGANETCSVEARDTLCNEVYAIRDSVVALANSKYLGVYIYGGTDDDDPPYDAVNDLTPTTGTQSDTRYTFDNEVGSGTTKQVVVTDTLTVQVSSSGKAVFGKLIGALEKLARALDGYSTNLNGEGETDAGGEAYDFEGNYTTEYKRQTEDITQCIDLLDTASKEQIIPEQSSIAGRLSRLEISKSILTMTNDSTKETLANLQEADIYESATKLTNAQTALQASYLVTNKLLGLSIMDYV